MKKNRLPFFLKSELYADFKLSKLLGDSQVMATSYSGVLISKFVGFLLINLLLLSSTLGIYLLVNKIMMKTKCNHTFYTRLKRGINREQ